MRAPAEFRFTSLVPAARVSGLVAWHSFEEIALRLGASPIVFYEWEPFQTSLLAGCHRASFVMQVDPQTYDAFFNSPVGIRGMYARSPSDGEASDRLLIDRLLPRLLALRDPPVEIHPWTAKSLSLHEAKVWIVESEVEEQLSADPSINYPPWERESLSGEGLRAPVGTQLEIKGGWLDLTGVERLNPSKLHRSLTLHKTGYI